MDANVGTQNNQNKCCFTFLFQILVFRCGQNKASVICSRQITAFIRRIFVNPLCSVSIYSSNKIFDNLVWVTLV